LRASLKVPFRTAKRAVDVTEAAVIKRKETFVLMLVTGI
jgi:hypothetical protein